MFILINDYYIALGTATVTSKESPESTITTVAGGRGVKSTRSTAAVTSKEGPKSTVTTVAGGRGVKSTRSTAGNKDNLYESFEKRSVRFDLLASDSITECPTCGAVYGEDESIWICCDNCDVWYNYECTGLQNEIPDEYFCSACQFSHVSVLRTEL
uniref:Zinc finger PHD-type domain-containing protein n=1 Tax=Amphimedon queenslandica TaxID=400682 RepID=A0A1X7V3W1_AMPQE